MTRKNDALAEQLNEQATLIERMREGFERIVDLEDEEAGLGEAKAIAQGLLALFGPDDDFEDAEDGNGDDAA